MIQKYHQEKQTESTNQEETSESSANQNTSPTYSSASSSFNDQSHARRASEGTKVTRNFSEIFSADSYTELTMLPDTHVIEPTGGLTLNTLSHSVSESDLPVEGDNKSHDLELQSHDTESEVQLKDDNEIVSKSIKTSPSSLRRAEFQTTIPMQRSQKGYFINMGQRKRFGSSVSLPETIGIPECSENGELSPETEDLSQRIVTPTKSDKQE